MWGIRFREYTIIIFYVEPFMDSITIYCTMMFWKATKLASYTYQKIIVTIIKSVFIKIKIMITMIRIYDIFII